MMRAALALCVVIGAAFGAAVPASAAPATDRSGISCAISWAAECQEAPESTTTTSVADAPSVPTSPRDDPFGTFATSTSTTKPGELVVPKEDGPGIFDVTGWITKAINDWFKDLVNSAAQPVLDLLGRLLLSTPDFTGDDRVRELWFVSWGIANTSFVLLVVAAGVLGMGHETVQTRHTVKELLPRLVVAFIAANASLVVSRVMIGFANALSHAFVDQGVGFEGAASVLKLSVTNALVGAPLFVTLVTLVVLVLSLCLIGTAIARVATVVVLVAAGPLFLIGHSLPHTDGAARLWWRALAGCLSVQVGQAVVLTTAIRVFFAAPNGSPLDLPGDALTDLLVVACLFGLMLRIPSYARHLVFNPRPNAAVSVVRYQVVGRAVRTAGKAAAKATTVAA